VDKEARNKYLSTPLHLAANYDRISVAKLLLDAGLDRGAKNEHNLTPWDLASSEIRQSLPELNPDFKQFESENFNAEQEMSDILGYDVKLFNQVSKLLFLSPEELQKWFEEEMGKEQPNWNLIEVLESQHGIEFDYKDLHWAAKNDSVGLAKYWIDKGVDMDAQAKSLWTPLHVAVYWNSEAVAKLLLDAGADMDARDKDLRTPLHWAAWNESEAITKLLIDAGADKGAKDDDGAIPWNFAGSRLRQSLPELNPDAKQFESENFNAEREMSDFLGYDVKLFNQVNKLLFLNPEELQEWFYNEIGKEEPRWDLIKILETQHGIKFDYKNLHWAAEQNKVGLAKYLLYKGADKNAQEINLNTPLHEAAKYDSEAVAKLLIDAGADKEAKNSLSRTPLHWAAINGSEAVAKLLIDAGADKGAKDELGAIPWDYARSGLRQSLPELNPDAKQFESENFDAEQEMSGILGYDVKLFHKVNNLLFLSPEELQQWFYNEMGKEEPRWDLIKALQSQHSIKFDYKDLHWAAEYSNIGLAKYWLDRGIDKDARNRYLSTPLHFAASNNSEAVAKLLIDAGADKNAKDDDLYTPLHWAASYGNNSEAVAKLLIDAGADKNAQNKYLRTPLHYAARDNRESVAKLLIDAGADKEIKDEFRLTPWDYATDELRQSLPELNPDAKQFESENFDAEQEMSGILGYDVKLFHQVNKLLFLSPEELQKWFYKEMEKEEPRWDLIKILQSQYGIEFDYKDLHWAIWNNKVGLAKYWLDKGADKDARNRYLRTPLHIASIRNREAIAKLLIDAGADKEAREEWLLTPLHLAAINNRKAIAKLLIDAGADKEARDKYLLTPLHYSARSNSKAVAKILIDAGADKGSKDNEDQTPWNLASSELRQSLPELKPNK
jgi:ankyrin repeat protein